MASKYDRDRPFTQDTNDFRTCNAYGRWAKYIDNRTGTRSDAAHAYIYDKAKNDNLFILTGKRVNRIVFKNGVATGIECVDEQDVALEVVLFQASKLVVLSAGTFGSPTILERSGIGSKEILESQGIPLVVDLPGVGENYHDHNSHMPAYFVDDDSDCMTDLYRNVDKAAITPHLDLWRQSGKGLVAHNGIDAGIKIRPTLREVELLGPGFQPLWNSFYAPSPDKPLSFIGPVAGYFGAANVERKIMGMLYYGAYPTSTGRVHISSTDPRAPVDFEFAFYRSEFDILAARYAYKGVCAEDGMLPWGFGAALKPFAQPVDAGERDIVYAEEDDTVLDVWHRATVSTSWHSLGTCAMKPREALGVVDPRLDVYGVRNLKIADLSIAPLNVGANTCNTALIIGEKAAGIIIQELGIVSKSRL